MGLVERLGVSNGRSFRLDKAVEDELVREARSQSKSVSNLIMTICEDHLNNHRWKEKNQAVTLLAPTLTVFLDYLDEDSLMEIGEKVGGSVPRRSYRMRGVPFDASVARSHILRVLGDYDRWFKVSYHDNGQPYYYIQNILDRKWVYFVEGYLVAFFKSLGVDVDVVRVGDNLQILV